MLLRMRTLVMVGASNDPQRASHTVASAVQRCYAPRRIPLFDAALVEGSGPAGTISSLGVGAVGRVNNEAFNVTVEGTTGGALDGQARSGRLEHQDVKLGGPMRFVPVRPLADPTLDPDAAVNRVLGVPAFASLSRLGAAEPGLLRQSTTLVDIFRRSSDATAVAAEAVEEHGARNIWLQEGVELDESNSSAMEVLDEAGFFAPNAEARGLFLIQDRCVKLELMRLLPAFWVPPPEDGMRLNL
jgi:predicted CoA-binding protein